MLDEEALATALRRALPPEHAAHVPRLARMLVAAVSDEEIPVVAHENPLPREVFIALAGQRIRSGNNTLSFGTNSQIGDVSVRDVASGDIYTINMPITVAPPPQPQRISEERKFVLFGITIFQSITTRTIELLTLGLMISLLGLAGLVVTAQFIEFPDPVVTALPTEAEATTTITTTVEPDATAFPAATEAPAAPAATAAPAAELPEAATAPVVVAPSGETATTDIPIATATNRPLPPTATPTASPTATPIPARLAVAKVNANDSPDCISVQVTGIAATGWTLLSDSLPTLNAQFDGGGNARVCGYDPGIQFTFTIVDAQGERVPGGSGVPARGGDIFVATWQS